MFGNGTAIEDSNVKLVWVFGSFKVTWRIQAVKNLLSQQPRFRTLPKLLDTPEATLLHYAVFLHRKFFAICTRSMLEY